MSWKPAQSCCLPSSPSSAPERSLCLLRTMGYYWDTSLFLLLHISLREEFHVNIPWRWEKIAENIFKGRLQKQNNFGKVDYQFQYAGNGKQMKKKHGDNIALCIEIWHHWAPPPPKHTPFLLLMMEFCSLNHTCLRFSANLFAVATEQRQYLNSGLDTHFSLAPWTTNYELKLSPLKQGRTEYFPTKQAI